MTRLPWITFLVAAVLALSPWGQEVFYAAFVSGEQLSRSIAQPIYFDGLAAMLGLILIEYLLRRHFVRPR